MDLIRELWILLPQIRKPQPTRPLGSLMLESGGYVLKSKLYQGIVQILEWLQTLHIACSDIDASRTAEWVYQHPSHSVSPHSQCATMTYERTTHQGPVLAATVLQRQSEQSAREAVDVVVRCYEFPVKYQVNGCRICIEVSLHFGLSSMHSSLGKSRGRGR